jgi:hypothetical protein
LFQVSFSGSKSIFEISNLIFEISSMNFQVAFLGKTKEVLNGNVCLFVVNEMDVLVQDCR